MKAISALSLSAALLVVACGPNAPAPQPEETPASQSIEPDRAGMISDGQAIVEANCTPCHAVHNSDESPRTDAPPLRYVLQNLSPDALDDDFREGIHVGAVDMPEFDLGPRGTASVVEYIKSIQVSGPPTSSE